MMMMMMQISVATSAAVVAVLLVLAMAQRSAAAYAPAAETTCVRSTCGNITVPYPFGIGPAGCSLPGFNLTCDDLAQYPSKLLLGNGSLQVADIFLRKATARAITTGAIGIRPDDGRGTWDMGLGDDWPYVVSGDGSNELVVSGCNVTATLFGGGSDDVIAGCSSSCSGSISHNNLTYGRAPSGGSGCCRAPILRGHTSYRVRLRYLDRRPEDAMVFIAEKGWFGRVADELLQSKEKATTAAVPVVLRWAVVPHEMNLQQPQHKAPPAENVSSSRHACRQDAARRICKSAHSSCSDTGRGYTCLCDRGYDGNPYIPNGCQDVGCFGKCTILPGTHECRCPPGTRGDPDPTPRHAHWYKVGMLIPLCIGGGSGIGAIFLAIFSTYMFRNLEHQRTNMLKQKFFKQNRGQLLQQLLSQRTDIAERMIIPLEELERATNNFDKARELGGGGHGTVYKGILSDQHVVAIKKSKIVIQREIDEFINEVAILSQINHRNVVKLFGCCLETEVPLLVYEFISNGTLHDHLHKEAPRSLPWKLRLRIATEIAKALAYLHSATAIPIIHRDIKSSNVLLDDTMTSKVSDFGASRYKPVDQTGITTAVQGTIGYLDPAYYYTGRLTEKSDVYSFGVILAELLTRKKPFSRRSSVGDGLVVDFVTLLAEGRLVDILDPQVIEEGGEEVEEVATLATSCIKLRGEDRPTMRQVEMILEGLQAPKEQVSRNMEAQKFDKYVETNYPSAKGGADMQEANRRYSLEEEFSLSARYPR